jgi:hypothetical protein
MKRMGWMVVCLAVFAALVTTAPAQAGKSKSKSSSSGPDTKCVIAFASTFPKVLSSVVKCADPASISVSYDIDASHLKYAAKICFCAKKDGKVDRYSCRKSRWYCVYVKCGKVESCSESRGNPS